MKNFQTLSKWQTGKRFLNASRFLEDRLPTKFATLPEKCLRGMSGRAFQNINKEIPRIRMNTSKSTGVTRYSNGLMTRRCYLQGWAQSCVCVKAKFEWIINNSRQDLCLLFHGNCYFYAVAHERTQFPLRPDLYSAIGIYHLASRALWSRKNHFPLEEEKNENFHLKCFFSILERFQLSLLQEEVEDVILCSQNSFPANTSDL